MHLKLWHCKLFTYRYPQSSCCLPSNWFWFSMCNGGSKNLYFPFFLFASSPEGIPVGVERWEERKRENCHVRNMDQLPPTCTPTSHQMNLQCRCVPWHGWNLRHLGLWATLQPSEPHRSRRNLYFIINTKWFCFRLSEEIAEEILARL